MTIKELYEKSENVTRWSVCADGGSNDVDLHSPVILNGIGNCVGKSVCYHPVNDGVEAFIIGGVEAVKLANRYSFPPSHKIRSYTKVCCAGMGSRHRGGMPFECGQLDKFYRAAEPSVSLRAAAVGGVPCAVLFVRGRLAAQSSGRNFDDDFRRSASDGIGSIVSRRLIFPKKA